MSFHSEFVSIRNRVRGAGGRGPGVVWFVIRGQERAEALYRQLYDAEEEGRCRRQVVRVVSRHGVSVPPPSCKSVAE